MEGALYAISEVVVSVLGTSFLAFAFTVTGTQHRVPFVSRSGAMFLGEMTRCEAGRESARLIKICTRCADTWPHLGDVAAVERLSILLTAGAQNRPNSRSLA